MRCNMKGSERTVWDRNKPTFKKSRAEVELTEAFDYIREIEDKLKKIEAVVQ